MTERRVTTKVELLADIERTWAALHTALKRLTDLQMTSFRDEQGWTVKDHITHMTAWERSVVFLLQGKPRHEGLNVPETLYVEGDFDEINAVIQEQHQNLSLSNTLAQFDNVHRQLLTLLQPLSDADLQKPYHYYLPERPDNASDWPTIDVLYGNSAAHFEEHLDWIEALVS